MCPKLVLLTTSGNLLTSIHAISEGRHHPFRVGLYTIDKNKICWLQGKSTAITGDKIDNGKFMEFKLLGAHTAGYVTSGSLPRIQQLADIFSYHFAIMRVSFGMDNTLITDCARI